MAKTPGQILCSLLPTHFPELRGRQYLGIDLTAGDPATGYDEGRKPFPLVSATVDEEGALSLEKVGTFTALRELLAHDYMKRASLLVIDGPCGANGITLRRDRSGFEYGDVDGRREAETALCARGIRLFWTTRNTIAAFDGAARWIARSLALFRSLNEAGRLAIETHPHAVYFLLRRQCGCERPLPRKTSRAGRDERLRILQTFAPQLDPGQLPDHDSLDAAAAALLAVLHDAGLTRAFGSEATGGVIWVPREAT